MKYSQKGFTLIELVIVVFIVAILSSLSYLSVQMIYESDIKNKTLDVIVFLDDFKSDLLQEKSQKSFVYLSNSGSQNKYIFGYNYKQNCEHIVDIDSLFQNNYIRENKNAYFTGSILSGSINLFVQTSRNNYVPLSSTGINYTHLVSDEQYLLYSLYGTGMQMIDGSYQATQVHCGDIKVYYLESGLKTKYQFHNFGIYSNEFLQNTPTISLQFTKNTFKPELYSQYSKNRILFDKISFSLKDSINNIVFENFLIK